MTRRAPIPEILGPAFDLARARDAGLTRRQLERPDLDRRFRGVRIRPSAPPPADEPRAVGWRREILRLAGGYAQRMDDEEFFSHTAAAVVWGLPVSASRDTLLDVTVRHPGRAPRSRAIRGHQVRPGLVGVVARDGLPVSSPASTWAMLGASTRVLELVVLGDAIVRIPRHPGGYGPPEPPPLGTLAQLRASIDAGRRVGVDRLRGALPLIRTGSSSRRETEVRLLLIDAGLPEPELDVDIRDEHGMFLGCSELAYPRYRIAFEYEGDHHRTSRRQWDRDIDKYQLYAEAGWWTIRITGALLRERPRELIRRTASALEARSWRR